MSTAETPENLSARNRARWGLRCGVLGAALVGGVVWWATRPDHERAELLQAARDGEFARAEDGLRKSYERDTADAEVVEALARGYRAAGDPRAEEYLTRWVELRPGESEPLRARMEFYRHRRDGRAYADARRLSDLDPANFQARRTAMNHAISFGYFEEAEQLCRECLARQPGDPYLRVLLAEVRRARGDRDGAAAVLDDLLREHPQTTGAQLLRATLYEEAGQSEKAVPLLRDLFDREPRQRRVAGYQLAVALERSGRPDEARGVMAEVRRLQDVEVYREAIKSQPDNLDLQVRLATALLADGHAEDGLGLLQAVLARDPGFAPACRALADHFEKQGDARRAADYRRRAGPP